MAFPDQLNGWINWMLANRAKVLRYTRMLQVFTGVILLMLGWYMGRMQFHLIRTGTRTQGRIVGSQTKRFSTRYSEKTGYMPVVEFQAGDRTASFTNWLGSSRLPSLNQMVPVLYDAANPTVAMIDRPVMNWIPWGPTALVGSFLVLVGIMGLLKRAPNS
jgi:hypothetical protein